ncbi:hypothetical protein BD780_002262 [Clostridium tetanomorphum]|uniref:Uncharacterized protein n=1 Tax=Clostridium tetanomorphum TaxID=1553 RepID=A0A923E8Z0_CLOTT|nr:hypothetical protein [Clostridium tetanomorphum]MBC2396629.1 hypothetical protein [Clostridium tetanomorphum]MBP1863959.1 hypothetical protein [Clostridium tetanomorphum]NRS85037.1 hypothetical protein [Clostridium tetanomorphum]NRZ98253.1 hypothetical protein [Clostridium tetanomorphum]SQB91435.1 Uncharacterised protein [Clostridium tetanomorphum]
MFINNKMIKRHRFRCLSNGEKMCIAGMIVMSYMKGILLGMYLNEK